MGEVLVRLRTIYYSNNGVKNYPAGEYNLLGQLIRDPLCSARIPHCTISTQVTHVHNIITFTWSYQYSHQHQYPIPQTLSLQRQHDGRSVYYSRHHLNNNYTTLSLFVTSTSTRTTHGTEGVNTRKGHTQTQITHNAPPIPYDLRTYDPLHPHRRPMTDQSPRRNCSSTFCRWRRGQRTRSLRRPSGLPGGGGACQGRPGEWAPSAHRRPGWSWGQRFPCRYWP